LSNKKSHKETAGYRVVEGPSRFGSAAIAAKAS